MGCRPKVESYKNNHEFNVESKVIFGKFLSIKIFNFPNEKNPIRTILRKPNSKYDMIPFNSNVSPKYEKITGLGYFKTKQKHTCSASSAEVQKQQKL